MDYKEIWIIDALPLGRPAEAAGAAIPFSFRGESLAFASKEDADKWLSEYGAGGRLWHVTNIATVPNAVEAAETILSNTMEELIEKRVAEILTRAGLKLPAEPAATVSTVAEPAVPTGEVAPTVGANQPESLETIFNSLR